MKNIVDAAKEIQSKATGGSVNYLVLSQGIWLFVEPKQSLNGIDLRLVLNFYSRWKVRLLTIVKFRPITDLTFLCECSSSTS